jgi:hypothetical protein
MKTVHAILKNIYKNDFHKHETFQIVIIWRNYKADTQYQLVKNSSYHFDSFGDKWNTLTSIWSSM